MIKKSIITAAILFVVYELLLRITDIQWDTSQNDKSANIISIQDFLYKYSLTEISSDTVIVGTSVSRKLVADSIGEHYINLAFNAWSGFDGLELIRLSGRKPACILIETNYAKNQILEPEITANLDPISYYSGKTFKSLQLRNQPVGLLIGYGKNLMKSSIEKLKEEKRSNSALFNLNLQLNKEIMNEKIQDSILHKRFVVLKYLIDQFKKENSEVIFYEVPINSQLQNTNSMVEVRNYYESYFPKNQYKWIPLPGENNFTFSDGVHLATQSALKYSLYLKRELSNY